MKHVDSVGWILDGQCTKHMQIHIDIYLTKQGSVTCRLCSRDMFSMRQAERKMITLKYCTKANLLRLTVF